MSDTCLPSFSCSQGVGIWCICPRFQIRSSRHTNRRCQGASVLLRVRWAQQQYRVFRNSTIGHSRDTVLGAELVEFVVQTVESASRKRAVVSPWDQWRRVILDFAPDLVVCDGQPGARTRVPDWLHSSSSWNLNRTALLCHFEPCDLARGG